MATNNTRTADDEDGPKKEASLEEVLNKLDGLASGQTTLLDRMERIESRAERTETSVDRLETSMNRMETSLSNRLGRVEDQLVEVRADVKFVLKAASATSPDIDDHETRLRKLEQRAA